MPVQTSLTPLKPTEKGTTVNVTVTDSGRVVLHLQAGELELTGEKGSETVIKARGGVNLQAYNRSGEPLTFLTAEKGTVMPSEGKLWAEGRVLVASPQGDTLHTDELVWDRQRDIIFTKKDITFKRGEEVIEGRGFTSRSDLTDWEIEQVRAIISSPYVPSDKSPR